jgi:hypothetical protein
VLPRDATLAVIETELQGARAWAERRQYTLTFDPDTIALRLVLRHATSGESFFLRGIFDSYPELPPIWTFTGADGTGADEPRYFPRAHGQPPCSSWLFITRNNKGVICAGFNRLAFSATGPHPEWGDAVQWRSVAAGYIQAHEIGLMLAAIDRDLQYTTGRAG